MQAKDVAIAALKSECARGIANGMANPRFVVYPLLRGHVHMTSAQGEEGWPISDQKNMDLVLTKRGEEVQNLNRRNV